MVFSRVGYTVSKEALRLFILEALLYPEKCYPEVRSRFQGLEDAEFGECMRNVGILPQEIVDEQGRGRCFEFNPVQFIAEEQNANEWEEVWPLFQIKSGKEGALLWTRRDAYC